MALIGSQHSASVVFTVGEMPQALADPHTGPDTSSTDAIVARDYSTLEDVWGASTGPSWGIRYVEPPPDIHAGQPLLVDVTCNSKETGPLEGTIIQVDWLIGTARYHDVGYTDMNGNARITRTIDRAGKGQRCLVAVRAYKADWQGLAYSAFVAK